LLAGQRLPDARMRVFRPVESLTRRTEVHFQKFQYDGGLAVHFGLIYLNRSGSYTGDEGLADTAVRVTDEIPEDWPGARDEDDWREEGREDGVR
jgi:hypothetical protein